MKRLHPLVAISLALLLLAPVTAMAGEGHDHGPAAPAASGPALPRFAAVSDLFELVGVLDGRQLTLYLDRTADNSPVTEARIELEMSGKTFQAARQGTDEFVVVLPEAPAPGLLPITATVGAGSDTDLLAGELVIPEAAHSDAPAAAPWWRTYGGWAAGGAALLAVAAALVVVLVLTRAARRARASRLARAGGAA